MDFKVVTIIVTYNPIISKLIEVLHAHICTDVTRIVIIDNASLNYSDIEQAVKSFGLTNIELVRLPENSGIAAAQNIGIRRAIEVGCSHVMLFDQDSLTSPETVNALLTDEAKLIAAGVRVGAIGPSFRDPRSGSLYPQIKIKGPMLKKLWLKSDTEPVEVSFIIASGSLIRIDVLKHVGTMNEEFFIDSVDVEWCLRAIAQGYRIFVSTKAIMSHTIGDHRERSLGREISIHSPLRRYYIARNSILLARLPWVPLGFKIREVFCVLTRVPVFLLAVNFNWNYIKYITKGILHGLLGRSGQYK